jgi:hypothetical protein
MSVLGIVFMCPNHQVIGCMLGILLAAFIIYLKGKYLHIIKKNGKMNGVF